MIVTATTRIVTRFLREHPEWSVAERLRLMMPPPPPDTPCDEIKAIYNEIDDASVSVNVEPDKTPCLYVLVDTLPDVPFAQRRGQIDAENMLVSVQYLVGGHEGSDVPMTKARQDWGYLSVAIFESLTALGTTTIANLPNPNWRSLGVVEILKVERLTEVPLSGMVGSVFLVGGITAQCHVRRFTAS